LDSAISDYGDRFGYADLLGRQAASPHSKLPLASSNVIRTRNNETGVRRMAAPQELTATGGLANVR
jgi:hypothetical protein